MEQEQSSSKTEKPIFTLKQMTLIAERMCTDRVEQVRSEYDTILQQKLSEQVIIIVCHYHRLSCNDSATLI